MAFSRILVFAKTTPGLERTLRAELTQVLGGHGSFLEKTSHIEPEQGVVAVWVSHEGLLRLLASVSSDECGDEVKKNMW